MSKPPLWRYMQAARHNRPLAADSASAEANAPLYAAEICALRDWLKARLPEGGAWYVLLTAEAARAERGEVEP